MKEELKTIEYVQQLQNVKLSEASRARMSEALLAHARFHGVRMGKESRSIERVPQRTSLFNSLRQPKSMTAALIAITLVVGGGTSYAAQGALPGDALYVVKTEINENIKSAFAIGSEAEAVLQAQLAVERLKEAEELAARGQLTATAATDIQSRLKTHYDNTVARIAAVEAKGDYDASAAVRASLEGGLRTHAAILTDLDGRVEGNSGAALINDIRAYIDATVSAQTSATATVETATDVRLTSERMLARAAAALAAAQRSAERAEATVSADASARAEARVADAAAAHAAAAASFRAGAYQEAYVAAQTAVRLASEVEAMLESSVRIDIDAALDNNLFIDVRGQAGSSTEAQDESEPAGNEDVESAPTEPRPGTVIDLEATVDTSIDANAGEVDAEVELPVQTEVRL